MGIEPFLVGSALDCVLAQRLARRLCSKCKEPYTPTPETLVAARYPWNPEEPVPTLLPGGRVRGVRQDRVQGPAGAARGDERERGASSSSRSSGRRRPRSRHVAHAEGMVSLRLDGMHKVRDGDHVAGRDPARRGVTAAAARSSHPVPGSDGARRGRMPSQRRRAEGSWTSSSPGWPHRLVRPRVVRWQATCAGRVAPVARPRRRLAASARRRPRRRSGSPAARSAGGSRVERRSRPSPRMAAAPAAAPPMPTARRRPSRLRRQRRPPATAPPRAPWPRRCRPRPRTSPSRASRPTSAAPTSAWPPRTRA